MFVDKGGGCSSNCDLFAAPGNGNDEARRERLMDVHLTNHLAEAAKAGARERGAENNGAIISGLRFYGDEFVFDTVSGMFFRLSATASFILRSIVEGVQLADLPAAMERRYGIDRATAARDVQLFLNELSALEPLGRFVHDKATTH